MRRHKLGVCLLGLALSVAFGARRVDVAESWAQATALGTPLELEPTYHDHHYTEPAALEVETRYQEPQERPRKRLRMAGAPPTSSAALQVGEFSPHNGVALTFDTEIPHGIEAQQTLRRVLDILSERRVHATFFIVGRWARANPELLRRIVAGGNEVASHSFTHAPFAGRSAAALRAELRGVERIVWRDTGEPVSALFRPPYGCIDADAARLVRSRGYRLIGWDISGRDASNETESPSEVVAAVRRNLHPGGTILLHTNRWITAGALPGILRLLAHQGLQPMTVSGLLRRQPMIAASLARAVRHPCHTEQPLLVAIAHHPAAR